MLDSPLNIVLIGVCVIAVLYLIYRMFFDKPITTPQITTKAASYDAAAVQQGLTAAGVNTTQENFEATTNSTTLVLDTKDKFNKNITYFITTFVKMINMDNVNKYIVDNGINKTTKQIETEKNINFYMRFNDIFMFQLDVLFFAGTNTDKILIGLAIIMIQNIWKKETGGDNDFTYYYMNDFDTTDDMYIYFIHDSYTGDRTKLNTDTNIPIFVGPPSTSSFKLPLFKLMEIMIIDKLTRTNNSPTTSTPITSSSQIYIDYKNKTISNKTTITTMAEYYIACMYCYYDNPINFTPNSPIINKFRTFMLNTPDYLKSTLETNNNIDMHRIVKNRIN
jgi:hypothetical protein